MSLNLTGSLNANGLFNLYSSNVTTRVTVDKSTLSTTENQSVNGTQSDWQKILEACRTKAQASTDNSSSIASDILIEKPTGCPYAALSKDGFITYNGVTFNCDFQNNAISLGDVSDKSNNLYINLSSGGTLIVCKDNIADLQKAITMFSAGDQSAIFKALAAENMRKTQLIKAEEEESETIENL